MAEFNECAGLIDGESMQFAQERYEQCMEQGINPLQELLDIQTTLQKKLHEKLPERNVDPTKIETCGGLVDWMRKNFDAIDDERRELLTALGGMSNGEKKASAVWKDWKTGNVDARNVKFTDLKLDDKLEVYFELIDQLHFFLNKFIALGMDAEDIFTLFMVKNFENVRRYESGY